MNTYLTPELDARISFIALAFLLAIIIFFSLKHHHDMKLIKKAVEFLDIPARLAPYLHTNLLSIYKHQPCLKDVNDKIDYLQLVATNDEAHLHCIMNKIDELLAREKEYGEAFFYANNSPLA